MGKQQFRRKTGMKRRNSKEPFRQDKRHIRDRKTEEDPMSSGSGMKRRNSKEPFRQNKRHIRDRKMEEDPMSSGSDDPSNEKSDKENGINHEEAMTHNEPTMYENLLQSLRKKEAVMAGLEEDSDDEDEDEEEIDAQRSILGDVGDDDQENDLGDGADSDVSDTDDEDNVTGRLSNTSTFHKHLEYKLSQEEVNKLLEKKWNYKWDWEESNGKWRGTGECFLKQLDMDSCNGLKPVLHKHWMDTYKESGGEDFNSSKQRSFFSICNSYRDILHHKKKPFYLKGREEDASIMDAYAVHSLNHVFMTRDLVKKNRAKLVKAQENMQRDVLNSEAFLDQGFTRPKVLILLPFASIAFRLVRRLIELTPPKYKAKVDELERFLREFGSVATNDEDEDEKTPKPSDHKALFGGNNNDHFMLGVKFNRRSIRLYGDFYTSDMIIASPLGLLTKIGESRFNKAKDTDYLSSIEVLIIDHADIILMQNWSHVTDVVKELNNIPSHQRGADIMRIRHWYLEEQAKFYRQTIILSSHINPDIYALFNHHCLNYEGKMKLDYKYMGIHPKIVLQVRQVYLRFHPSSILNADDARFEHFTNKVFPKIRDSIQGGIMIFISSYFDYVRLRNFLRTQEASFCQLSEYTKQSNISRARNWFFSGNRKIMLYTERAHFYHRYKIRGIQNLIIYSLPERKEFYPEIVNMLQGAECTIQFSRFDLFKLERIVGSAAAKRMTSKAEEDTFVYV